MGCDVMQDYLASRPLHGGKLQAWHELASAGQFDGQGDHHTPKPYVRQTFRK